MKMTFAFAFITAAFVTQPAFATISIGDDLQIEELFPDMNTVASSNYAAYTGQNTQLSFPIGTATFLTGDRAILDLTGTDYQDADFNGLKISDLTNPDAFTGWHNLEGTVNNYGFFSENGSLYVRLLPQTSTGTILIGTSVPEPSTWALMLVGFGGIGYAGWRGGSRKSAAVTAN